MPGLLRLGGGVGEGVPGCYGTVVSQEEELRLDYASGHRETKETEEGGREPGGRQGDWEGGREEGRKRARWMDPGAEAARYEIGPRYEGKDIPDTVTGG